MADDIIPLRRSYALSMVQRISELEAEVNRLRAAGHALACGVIEAQQAENERLRAAGDALAYGVGEWFGERISDEMCGLVAAWQEACRG